MHVSVLWVASCYPPTDARCVRQQKGGGVCGLDDMMFVLIAR